MWWAFVVGMFIGLIILAVGFILGAVVVALMNNQENRSGDVSIYNGG